MRQTTLPDDDNPADITAAWAERSNDAPYEGSATLWGYRFALTTYRNVAANASHEGKVANAVITLDAAAAPTWPDGFRPLRGPGASDPEPLLVRGRAAIHIHPIGPLVPGTPPRTGDAAFDDAVRIVSYADTEFVERVLAHHVVRHAALTLTQQGYTLALFDPTEHSALESTSPVSASILELKYAVTQDPEALSDALRAMSDLADHLPVWEYHPKAQREASLWERSQSARDLLGVGLLFGVMLLATTVPHHTTWGLLAASAVVGVALAAFARVRLQRAYQHRRYAPTRFDLSVLLVPFAASVLALSGLNTLASAPIDPLPATLVRAQEDGTQCAVVLEGLEGNPDPLHLTLDDPLDNTIDCYAFAKRPTPTPVHIHARRGLFGVLLIDAFTLR